MGIVQHPIARGAMVSPWRRRRVCMLSAGSFAQPVVLTQMSARGATIEALRMPVLGSKVMLNHPEAGDIEGRIEALLEGGAHLSFTYDERSVAFVLAAITADMSRPG